MKISKVSMFAIGGLLALCSASFVAEGAKQKIFTIKQDLDNAVQHINSMEFIETGNALKAVVDSIGSSLVHIDTNNFLIGNSNKIQNSQESSILGGNDNKINGGTDSVIIAGKDNKVAGKHSVIRGGISNTIEGGEGSVIMGGSSNNIKMNSTNSTIVGGDSNMIRGNNSIIAGNNSKVMGDNSVALGSGSIVRADKSFLWSDSNRSVELDADAHDVFAIVGSGGMVVNTNAVAEGAQLTIGGSMVVTSGARDLDAACGNGNGTGLIKSVKNGSGVGDCLCTCNGNTRNSLYGEGKCEAACKGDNIIEPKCGNTVQKIEALDGSCTYSGSCEVGHMVKDWIYVDSGDVVHWICQISDGTVSTVCSAASTAGTCTPNIEDPRGGFECLGSNPGEHTRKSSQEPHYATKPWTYVSNTNAELKSCQWTCEDGYVRDGNTMNCKLDSKGTNGCSGTIAHATLVPGSDKNVEGLVESTAYNTLREARGKKCAYVCDDGYGVLGNECREGVSNIGCNMSNFTYSTITITDPSNPSNYFVIMDRNLGATSNDINSASSYGCMFQWGNNYGFPSTGSVTTSTQQVDASSYGPNNPYSSGVFVVGQWARDSSNNRNLWGGADDINNNYDSLNDRSNRQGPCPEGWHVPSIKERSLLVKYWSDTNGAGSSLSQTNGLYHLYGINIGRAFSNYFHLPRVGYRSMLGSIDKQRTYGYYWSSSSDAVLLNGFTSYFVRVSPEGVSDFDSGDGVTVKGYSVRCFKDLNITYNIPDETYDCGGSKPSGSGYKFGSGTYTTGHIPTSWTYTGGATLGACEWTCDNGYEKVGDECQAVDNIGCDMANFTFETITITDPSDSSNSITIMDRNLGATSNDTTKKSSYGCFFQWGNNHGFPWTGNIKTSSVQVNASSYGPSKPFSRDTFIISSSIANWDSSKNSNLWGGSLDNESNNRGYPVTNSTDRQGPCPEGWHVPSAGEWSLLIKYWHDRYAPGVELQTTNNLYGFVGPQAQKDLMNYFKISSAGSLQGDSSYVSTAPALHRSSSPMSSHNSVMSLYFSVIGSLVKVSGGSSMGHNNHGLSVRCFKDSDAVSCGAGYYRDGNECVECSVGYYCPGDGNRYKCTNSKPANSVYAGYATDNNCAWTCDFGYYLGTGGYRAGSSFRIVDDEHEQDYSDDSNAFYVKGFYTTGSDGTLKYYSGAWLFIFPEVQGTYGCHPCTEMANSYWTSNGLSGAESCQFACYGGYYYDESNNGTYYNYNYTSGRPIKGSGSGCTMCEPGKYSLDGNTLTSCVSCPAGTRSKGVEGTRPVLFNGEIVFLPVTLLSGSEECVDCEAGTYSTGGASTCSTCPSGYYCPGGSNAKICPAGTSSQTGSITYFEYNGRMVHYDTTVSTGATRCYDCAPGTYSNAGAGSCTTCEAGYYCPGGTGHIICPAGTSSETITDIEVNGRTIHYRNTVSTGAISCTDCPVGTYSEGGAGSCTECTNGPTNATYTTNSTTNNCSWECQSPYTLSKDGKSCTVNNSNWWNNLWNNNWLSNLLGGGN